MENVGKIKNIFDQDKLRKLMFYFDTDAFFQLPIKIVAWQNV